MTSTSPAACGGVVTVIAVEVTFVTVVTVPPNFTAAPAKKFVPFTVAVVPPAVVPLVGVTEVTVAGGGATYV